MPTTHHQLIDELVSQANAILLGKESRIKLSIAALFANGNLLINDLPGVGKTTLANLLARLFGLDFQRIQFTSDLLPADITGVSVFDPTTASFEFHPGPLFGQLILADEINRATPKTQSALLEAMEERQVTIEGKSHALPEPFFVIATQNPLDQAGTFPLPESQLDRFLFSIDLGYPDHRSERQMLQHSDPRSRLTTVRPVITANDLLSIQQQVNKVHCADALLDYLQSLAEFSRTSSQFITGYSPRALMGILRGARAWAYINQRAQVIPEDIQAILPATAHHLKTSSGNFDMVGDFLRKVPVP